MAVPGDFRGVFLRNLLCATLPIGRVLRPADDVAAIPLSLMATRGVPGRAGRCETGGRMIQDNEKLVRAFYEATAPGHRQRLRALQSPRVVYDIPEGMPVGAGHFEGLQEILERFLTSFYGALDVHFVAEEFIAGSEQVVAIGRIEGATRKARVPIDVAFVHVWTVGDGRLQRLRAFTDTAVLARALAHD